MKLLTYLLVGIYTATIAQAAPSQFMEMDAETACGRFGVMKVDPADLPAGVTMAEVRKCRDHPMGRPEYPGPGARGGAGIPSIQIVPSPGILKQLLANAASATDDTSLSIT
ncbi:hypothetical protein BP00DRAFT_448758 [Aspergillus indologenus CBS 114.80]|uniref:Uncharacterized protein n=1 Tax=Aspergillus indologenus CBS 114.80 TaxID=1450541 RepID=A0A2V5HX52_9EURO|nr:hypothetical protein BP00DRAFT_448758 [Aspergillus indologenus CBS 114.80]